MLRAFACGLFLVAAAALLVACGGQNQAAQTPVATPTSVFTPGPATDADREFILRALSTTLALKSYHTSGTSAINGLKMAVTDECDFVAPDNSHIYIPEADSSLDWLVFGGQLYGQQAGAWVKSNTDSNGFIPSPDRMWGFFKSHSCILNFTPSQFGPTLQNAQDMGDTTLDGVRLRRFQMRLGSADTLDTLSLWIDPQTAYLHRVIYEYTVSGVRGMFGDRLTPTPTALPPTTSETIVTFSRYNDPSITVPDPSQPVPVTPTPTPALPTAVPVPATTDEIELLKQAYQTTKELKSYHVRKSIPSGSSNNNPIFIMDYEGVYVAPDKVYVKGAYGFQAIESLATGGKAYRKQDDKWVEQSPGDLRKILNATMPTIPEGTGTPVPDPATMLLTLVKPIDIDLQTLLDNGGKVEAFKGEGTLNGVTVRRFLVSYDMAKITNKLPGEANRPTPNPNWSEPVEDILWVAPDTGFIYRIVQVSGSAVGSGNGTTTPAAGQPTPAPSGTIVTIVTEISGQNDPTLTVPNPDQ